MNEDYGLQAVHEKVLEILDFFMAFCEQHQLRYYFTGGALIGVLRHGGFIPWDDDIDIGMPRKDYDRFLALCADELPERFFLLNRHTDKSWRFNMSQLVDKETEVDIYLTEQSRRSNIWLDIFPLDGLPAGERERRAHMQAILRYRYLIQLANISSQVDAKRQRPLKEKLVLGLARRLPLAKVINSSKLLDQMEAKLRSQDFDSSSYAGNLLGRYREREVVPQDYFGQAKTGLFEGRAVAIPERSHELQTALYGDYMALPPEADRTGHHVVVLEKGSGQGGDGRE